MTCTIELGYDATRSGNLVVGLTETGGGGATGTITLDSTYMPITNCNGVYSYDDNGVEMTESLGYVSMQTTLKAALEAIGAATYTCTLSITTRKWTFVASGGGVTAIALTFNAAAQAYFGFGASVSGALTHVGTKRAHRLLVGSEGGVTEWRPPHEVIDDLATDVLSAGGTHEGISQRTALKRLSMRLPFEPSSVVWINEAGGEYSWEVFFKQARNVEPICVIGHITVVASGRDGVVFRLAADACAFDPQLLAAEYFAYADIVLDGYLIGLIS